MDAELADRKGRLMEQLLARYSGGGGGASPQQQGREGGRRGGPGAQGGSAAAQAAGAGGGGASACPFGHGRVPAAAVGTTTAMPAAAGPAAAAADGFEAAQQQLYSWEGVPAAFRDMVAAEAAQQAQQLGLAPFERGNGSTAGGPLLPGLPLAFLDHAWGQVPPLAQVREWLTAMPAAGSEQAPAPAAQGPYTDHYFSMPAAGALCMQGFCPSPALR